MINPSAAASERTREHARVLIHHWKRLTGIQVGIHYAEGDERQLTDLIAAELSAKDAEIEALTQDRNSWRRVAERLESEKTTARADAIRECVEKVTEMRDQYQFKCDASESFDVADRYAAACDTAEAVITTLESLLNEKDTK